MVSARSLAGCSVVALALTLPGTVHAKRPFTVDDSIGLTRTSEASAYFYDGVGADFPISPDGKKFLVVTSRGDVASGLDRYDLTMYDVDGVLRFVTSDGSVTLPEGDLLATFETPKHSPGIGNVQWIDAGKSILFVGRRADSRVYRLTLANRQLEALTPPDADAWTATLSADGRRLIYTVSISDYQFPAATGYVLDAQRIASQYATSSNPSDFVKKVAYFVRDVATGEQRPLAAQPSWFPQHAWISPDSSHAVVAVNRFRAPASWWTRYRPMQNYMDGAVTSEWVTQYAEGNLAYGDSARHFEFVLVNLSTGAARPITDAPMSDPQYIAPARMVAWRPDSKQLVLSGTCVALPTESRVDAGLCQQIVSYDLDSGRLRVLGPQDEAWQGRALKLVGVDFGGQDELRVLYRNKERRENAIRILEPHRVDAVVPYRETVDGWAKGAVVAGKRHARVHIKIRQGPNEPWQLEAIDARSGRTRVITNWNPQLSELELGTLEIIEWKGERGETIRAGLVKPTGYDSARRYPLVIQTYGFEESEFLVDGSDRKRTMFAARALAARGFLVLQMPQSPWSGKRDFDRFVINREWLRSAVDSLTSRGLVDPSRVGLIGFSFTGQQTWDAITFADLPIAAAIVADSSPVVVGAMADSYGVLAPGMLSWERIIGAKFWGSGVDTWMKRSPVFNLDRIRAPLLLERYGYWPMVDWDCYTILKRERRPVELIHRPAGRHAMGDVTTTRLAQQAAVDWFSFWLQDFEDPNPAKVAQYVRWRNLRRDRDALPPPPPKWTSESLPAAKRLSLH